MQQTSTLLLVGKPGHLRDALAGVLADHPLVCADSGPHALKAAHESSPALTVLGPGLPQPEIPALVSQLKSVLPRAACLVLADFDEDRQRALCAGADAVISCNVTAVSLLALVNSLIAGG